MQKLNINGLLWLDKPTGISSNQALQKAKRIFQAKKAGHGGSLDPLATGLLPICFGEVTKYLDYLLNANKTYLVTAKFGIRTDTADSEGKIISEFTDTAKIQELLNQTTLLNHIKNFIGEIIQTPPIYSALKHQGQPLYKLARKQSQENQNNQNNIAAAIAAIKKRKINIFAMTIKDIDLINNTASFIVYCSKGTYIRSLIDDLGMSLGIYAHIIALRREEVSTFSLLKNNIKAYSLEELQNISNIQDGCMQNILCSIDDIFINHSTIHPIYLSDKNLAINLLQGKKIVLPAQTIDNSIPTTLLTNITNIVSIFNTNKKFIGIGILETNGLLTPKRMFST